MLDALDQGYRAIGDFFAALERYELLEPFSLDVDASRRVEASSGRLSPDRRGQVAARSSPARWRELHSAGHLMPIFMAVASVSNIVASWSRARTGGTAMADAAALVAARRRASRKKTSAPSGLDARLKGAREPFVMRGLIADWPLVAGRSRERGGGSRLLARAPRATVPSP